MRDDSTFEGDPAELRGAGVGVEAPHGQPRDASVATAGQGDHPDGGSDSPTVELPGTVDVAPTVEQPPVVAAAPAPPLPPSLGAPTRPFDGAVAVSDAAVPSVPLGNATAPPSPFAPASGGPAFVAPGASSPPLGAAPVRQPGAFPSGSPFVGAGAAAAAAPAGWGRGDATARSAAGSSVGRPAAGYPAGPPLYDAAPGRGWGAPAPSVAAVPALPAVDEPRPRRAVGLGVAALMALVAGLVAAAVTGGLILAFDTETAATSTSEGTTTPTTGPGGQLDIQALLAKVQPSVVSIRTGEEGGREVYGGAGSGVIISEEGLVLTNAHVIAGFNEMQVTLFDGEVLTAELVGSLPDDDIALIRLLDPDEELVPAELGSSADVQVGDRVVAIGNALNLSGPPSVTEGIVSAKDRTIPVPNSVLRNLIQTDAAINPGNSGGPLLNGAGEVVGINTAIIDDAQNIGFAIAIDEIKPVIEDLREGRGEITPDTAFLGVSTMAVSDVNASVLDEYGVLTEEGAFVTEVVPDSAAEAAGLRPGDVIVSIGGETIEGPEDVGERITSSEPGDELDIELERDGDVIETTVTLKSRADTGD